MDVDVQPQGVPAGQGRIDHITPSWKASRSFVERMNIVGNTRTKDKVIRREVLIAPGDVFNTVRVETTKKRLENLGYFSQSRNLSGRYRHPGRKDLTVQVEEKRTGSLHFGAGFSTIDS